MASADTSNPAECATNTTDEAIQNPEAAIKCDASAELIAAEAKAHEEAKLLEVETKNEATKKLPATPPATPIADPELNFPTYPAAATVPEAPSPLSDLLELISAPILEAATIVKAVAGISIPPSPPAVTTESSPSAVVSSPVSTPSVMEALGVAANPATVPAIGQTLVDTQTPSSPAIEEGKSTRDVEVEMLKMRVKTLETELAAALAKPGKNSALVETIKQQHEELLSRARGMLFDKTKILKNQELQIAALTAQIDSLKDVNSITKDLLEIRNTEVKHLEERMECMEARFKDEKERHLLMMKRAESGQAINNDLKTEYEGQLQRFKDLREMYDKRVQVLTAENQRLNGILAANGLA